MKKFMLTLTALVALLAAMSITASAAKVIAAPVSATDKENIAAGKTFTNTYPVRVQGNGNMQDCDGMFDGNHTNVATSMCVLDWTPDGYIVVDLGAQYTISGITLFNYMYPAQYCICTKWTYSISSDGQNFTELAQCKLPEEASEISASGYDTDNLGDPWIPKKDQVVEGRYIKLKVDEVYVGGASLDHKGVRIYEMEVYGELKAGEEKPAVDPAVQAQLDAQAAAKKAEEENKAWFAARKTSSPPPTSPTPTASSV